MSDTAPCSEIVAPAEIRDSLTRIRRQVLASRGLPVVKTPRARVLFSNLIIVSISNDANPCHTQHPLIDHLASSYPSRFFVVNYNCSPQSESGKLITSVGSRAATIKSGTEIVTEEIYATVSGVATSVIRNLLLSHLAPEVPVMTILLNDPRDTKLLSQESDGDFHALSFRSLLLALQEMSDTVIYDSAQFRNFNRSINALLSFKKVLAAKQSEISSSIGRPLLGEGSLAELRDISWRRTSRWRALIAEHFDSLERDAFLNSVTSLSLLFEASDAQIKAGRIFGDVMLIAAWLQHVLTLRVEGITRSEEGVVVLDCRMNNGRYFTMKLVPRREVDALRDTSTLRAVLMEFTTSLRKTALTFRVVPNLKFCEVTRDALVENVPPQNILTRRVSFYPVDRNHLILEELCSPVRDTIYRTVRDRALDMAQRLADIAGVSV